MTTEERAAINERIDKMIGSWDEQKKRAATMSLTDRINSNAQYRKTRDDLFKIAEREGEKALALTMLGTGRYATGVTLSGKIVEWEGNHGFTERSRYCGRLWIEGIGTVFTSGTITAALEHILKN